MVVRPTGFKGPKSTSERQLMRSLPQKWKAKRQERGMKREQMKGRITRIKHREIPVPSVVRFYGRQSMTRAVARARTRERASGRVNATFRDAYTMIRIHGLVPINPFCTAVLSFLKPVFRISTLLTCAPLESCASVFVERNSARDAVLSPSNVPLTVEIFISQAFTCTHINIDLLLQI